MKHVYAKRKVSYKYLDDKERVVQNNCPLASNIVKNYLNANTNANKYAIKKAFVNAKKWFKKLVGVENQ